MDEADDALRMTRALADDGREKELADAIEPVLDVLVDAGYVEVDGARWRFTAAGVDRANALVTRQTESALWPFDEGSFPPKLGVVAMRTIFDGNPVLQVVHGPEDWWGFADGVNSPNGDASITCHAEHVLELDPSLNELATLPPGFKADRDNATSPWVITPFEYSDD